MTNVRSRDRTEEVIKNSLQWGKRQQVEVVKITDRSKSTVRSHLKKLVENEEIERIEESGKVFYELSDGPTEPIKPKPSANDGEISALLDTIAHGMGVDSEIKQSEYETEVSEIRSDIYPDTQNDIVEAIYDFESECSRKYYVLSSDENLKKAMSILDELTAIYDDEGQNTERVDIVDSVMNLFGTDDKQTDSLLLPEELYGWYFASYMSLLRNWRRGKENKDLFPELSQRTDSIIRNSPQMPDRFGLGLQNVVLSVDDEKGREMFRRMAQYGNYEVETLREATVRTYEIRNDIDGLFKTLEDIERQVTGDCEEKIQRLVEEIRDDYQ